MLDPEVLSRRITKDIATELIGKTIAATDLQDASVWIRFTDGSWVTIEGENGWGGQELIWDGSIDKQDYERLRRLELMDEATWQAHLAKEVAREEANRLARVEHLRQELAQAEQAIKHGGK